MTDLVVARLDHALRLLDEADTAQKAKAIADIAGLHGRRCIRRGCGMNYVERHFGRGRGWSCPSRPRVDTAPHQDKLRWEMVV